MIHFLKTNSQAPDFIQLVKALDAELETRDGEEHAFYAQFNGIESLQHAIVAYDAKEQAVGCGAIKAWQSDIAEVKRMYVPPSHRGQGIASQLLQELEKWASELSFQKCVLETGKRQPEAIALYQKNGYRVIPNYGQYEGVENSVCFEKRVGE